MRPVGAFRGCYTTSSYFGSKSLNDCRTRARCLEGSGAGSKAGGRREVTGEFGLGRGQTAIGKDVYPL